MKIIHQQFDRLLRAVLSAHLPVAYWLIAGSRIASAANRSACSRKVVLPGSHCQSFIAVCNRIFWAVSVCPKESWISRNMVARFAANLQSVEGILTATVKQWRVVLRLALRQQRTYWSYYKIIPSQTSTFRQSGASEQMATPALRRFVEPGAHGSVWISWDISLKPECQWSKTQHYKIDLSH